MVSDTEEEIKLEKKWEKKNMEGKNMDKTEVVKQQKIKMLEHKKERAEDNLRDYLGDVATYEEHVDKVAFEIVKIDGKLAKLK